MSNIKIARDAIKAELKHVQEGLMFYQARVASLEEALAKLAFVDTPTPELENPRKRKSAVAAKPAIGRVSRKAPPVVKSEEEKLPSTGKDFWPDLLDAQPKTSAEIYEAAVKALGITLSKGQAKKLAQRQANAMSILSKNGAISSTGSGRTRQYFKQS